MAAAIGPGDWVECVDADGWVPVYRAPISVGRLYQVRDVGQHPHYGPLLRLVGVATLTNSGWFGLRRFRPIYPGGALIRKLLEKLPEDATPELENA